MTKSGGNWVEEPEGKTLEVKRDLSSPISIMKALIAFAKGPSQRAESC